MKKCKADEEKFLAHEAIYMCYENMQNYKECMKCLEKMRKLMKSEVEKCKVYKYNGKLKYLLVY